MSDKAEEHDEDCNKQKDYTDGIFYYCLCNARNMNTFVGAHIRRII
jgi:hypothetical protein